jgi:hypothetical protein
MTGYGLSSDAVEILPLVECDEQPPAITIKHSTVIGEAHVGHS